MFQGPDSSLKYPRVGDHSRWLFYVFSGEHLSYFVELTRHLKSLFWNSRYLLQLLPKNLIFLSFFNVTERTTER